MKIKILIAYHKLDYVIKTDCYVPIQLGRSITEQDSKDGKISNDDLKILESSMIGDNTGENVSTNNRFINELTAVYWAWKNYNSLGNPDYIGLTHYRRHFIFKETNIANREWLPNSNVYVFHNIDDDYLELINEKHLFSILGEYDGVISSLYDLRNLDSKYLSCRERFLEMVGVSGEVFDIAITHILNNFPEYVTDVEKFLAEPKNYLCNMFVFKKEDFFEYCNFIFSVIDHLDKHKDLYAYGDNTQKRAPGFIAEWLTTIFIYHIQRVKKRNLKTCSLTFLEDTTHPYIIKKKSIKQFKYALMVLMFSLIQILSFNIVHCRVKRRSYINKLKSSSDGYRQINSKFAKFILRKFSQLQKRALKIANFFCME